MTLNELIFQTVPINAAASVLQASYALMAFYYDVTIQVQAHLMG